MAGGMVPVRAATSGGELVGRARERRLLDSLIQGVHERGAALVLCGPPGIGKSALLDYVAGTAPATVLRVCGVESEAVLPFATLADIVLPLHAHLIDLPTVQRTALEACLALSVEPADNPYAACVGALNVLASAGEAAPVVVLVDDLHWVDPSSLRVLLFVARRLSSERVAVVFTTREDHVDVAARCGLPTVDVAGLGLADCADLLSRRGIEVAPGVLADVVRYTGGNPLALVETAGALSAGQLAGTEPVISLPPPGRYLDRAWSARLDELPEPTRRALAVVAASRSAAVEDLDAAFGVIGLGLDALGPAEDANLVVASAAGIEFRHPVLRPLVLLRTPLAHRLGAYRCLAEVTSGALHAWYLAAASPGENEHAAAALAQAALDARRRAAFQEAAMAWRRAADLTPAGPERGNRLRQAAADAFLAGGALDAARWCEEALHTTDDPLTRADIETMRGHVYTWTGQPARAQHLLVEAARSVRPADPVRAAALLAEAAVPAVMDARFGDAVSLAEESMAPHTGLVPPLPNRLNHALTLIMTGEVRRGRTLLAAAAEAMARSDPIQDQHLLVTMAQCWHWLDEPATARRLLNTAIDAARLRGGTTVLPLGLAFRSELDMWTGRWAAAYADATEALRWNEDLRLVSSLGYCLANLARIDAMRGDWARCEERISRARRELGPLRIGCVEYYLTSALGLAALIHGEYDAAASQLEQTYVAARRDGLRHPSVIPFAADLSEAHIRTGNTGRAVEVLEWLEIGAADVSWAAAAAARCRGLMATTLASATSWFRRAEAAHLRRELPMEHARTLLCRGEVLRRLRRPAAAREPLRRALSMFESLGVEPLAARAAAELAATGQRPTGRVRLGALDLLTPQELQVARAVARGLNNTEAAAALFVSRKTVEAHLTHAYRKLGVRSRTDLTRTLTAYGLVD